MMRTVVCTLFYNKSLQDFSAALGKKNISNLKFAYLEFIFLVGFWSQ